MGKLTTMIMAVIFTFFTVGLFALAIQSGSTDPTKTNFVMYNGSADTDAGSLLDNANVSYSNQDNPILSFKWVANTMRTAISEATTNFNNTDTSLTGVVNKLASAFGLIQALVLSLLVITLIIITESFNLAYGLMSNMFYLPAPWNLLSMLFGILLVSMLVYGVMQIYRSVKTGDNI